MVSAKVMNIILGVILGVAGVGVIIAVVLLIINEFRMKKKREIRNEEVRKSQSVTKISEESQRKKIESSKERIEYTERAYETLRGEETVVDKNVVEGRSRRWELIDAGISREIPQSYSDQDNGPKLYYNNLTNNYENNYENYQENTSYLENDYYLSSNYYQNFQKPDPVYEQHQYAV